MASIPWSTGENIHSLLAILATDQVPSYYDNTLSIDVDQAALDAAYAEYDSNRETHVLDPMRARKQEALRAEAYKYICRRYPQERQALLHALLTESIIDGRPNRANYLRGLLNWMKEVTAAQILAEHQVSQAADIEEIKAVQIDLEALSPADPGVTVKGALQIQD